jgi:hypothetical protein
MSTQNAWEVRQDAMPGWLSQHLLKGRVRALNALWWRDGLNVGAKLAMPGDRIVEHADGTLSVEPKAGSSCGVGTGETA